jgi:hypothetical protein
MEREKEMETEIDTETERWRQKERRRERERWRQKDRWITFKLKHQSTLQQKKVSSEPLVTLGH